MTRWEMFLIPMAVYEEIMNDPDTAIVDRPNGLAHVMINSTKFDSDYFNRNIVERTKVTR